MKSPLLILFLGGVVLTLGDLVMKKWVGNDQTIWYLGGLGLYLIGLVFLAQSFKFQNIAVASLVLVIFNVAILTIVSWVVFKESLSALKILGLFLGLLAVGILEFS